MEEWEQEPLSGEREIPRAAIEGRNSRADNLIIIDNVVYDVTGFLDEHPGGPEVLLDNGGRDASQCFRDVGHSDVAYEWRRRYRVGVVPAAERRPLLARAPPAPPPPPAESARALLAAAAPPLALAALAALLYAYLL